MLTRGRRSGERGQTLILALAFLAMFALFSAAILTFASGVQTQRGLTETSASIDSVAEGSAQFAIADTGVQGCGTVSSGTMTFASGDTLSYNAANGACLPSPANLPGQNCGLCVLNQNNVATPLSVQKGDWTVPGEINVNGKISVVSVASGSSIGLFGSGDSCGTICGPASAASDGTLTISSTTAGSPSLFANGANYVGDIIVDSKGYIPASTTVTAENNTGSAVGGLAAHSVTLSNNATATASGDTFTLALASASDGTLTKNSATAGSATLFANGTNLVGDVITDSKGQIPAGTTVSAENNTGSVVGGLAAYSVTLSNLAKATASGDTFTTWLPLASKVLDPLGGALPVPTPAGSQPAASGNATICPGTYSSLSANGGILFLSPYGKNGCVAPSANAPSLYVITGSISLAGGGSLVASGSTLYLSPSASFSTTGNGDFSVDCGGTSTSSACGTADTPTTGPYAGVAIFMDPGNTSTLSLQGNGNFTVAGTFEASHAVLSLGGNGGSQSFQSGRLIISEIQGSGNGGAGLGFGGVFNSSGCSYWTDKVTGTLANHASLDAHVRFESACNSGGPTSIIGFAHGNGP